MSFLYPRTISISRPVAQVGVGAIGYGGQTEATETVLFTGIQASIQQKKEGQKPDLGLPGDTSKRSMWRIFILLARGSLKDRDIVTDDEGIRYQILAAYWNSLGYNCACERLEA